MLNARSEATLASLLERKWITGDFYREPFWELTEAGEKALPKRSFERRREAIGVANELSLKLEQQHGVKRDVTGNRLWRIVNRVTGKTVDAEGSPTD
jgi:hypothetical protein